MDGGVVLHSHIRGQPNYSVEVVLCCHWGCDNSFKMVCNWILYSVDIACQNCSKLCIICYVKNVENHTYFCGRILARILRSRKVYEVFHVCQARAHHTCLLNCKPSQAQAVPLLASFVNCSHIFLTKQSIWSEKKYREYRF